MGKTVILKLGFPLSTPLPKKRKSSERYPFGETPAWAEATNVFEFSRALTQRDCVFASGLRSEGLVLGLEGLKTGDYRAVIRFETRTPQ